MNINKSSVSFNEVSYSPRCYCVLGVPRSGTSMVSGMLRLMGVNMGESLDLATNEDELFLTHKGMRDIFSDVSKKESYLKTIVPILSKNNEKKLWGWKDPLSSYYIEDVYEKLINPIVIVVTRDPVATVQGEMRFRDSASIEYDEKHFLASIGYIASEYAKIASFVARYKPKVMFISYEKVFKDKELFISEFSSFCGIELTENMRNTILNYIEPGRNTGAI